MRIACALIAAPSARSKAYAQILRENNIRLDAILLMAPKEESEATDFSVIESVTTANSSLFYPDLGIPLDKTCREISDHVSVVNTDTINSEEVKGWLKEYSGTMAIYSGFSGQIVDADVLSLPIDFLHMHSGWLPEYRGSTTMFYSILLEKKCSVSAILLDEHIDTGQIVERRDFAMPNSREDLDHLFDSAIRANLMLDVVTRWQNASGHFNSLISDAAEGQDYYVIHPVLKHLAVMVVEQGSDEVER